MNAQISVRLDENQAAKLERIARLSYNKPAGLIRYAIDELIRVAEANGGSLMPPLPSTVEPASSQKVG
ncbi:MAG: hypothetical protein V4710_23290 [Verrucomicrobiota bacterium]